MIKKRQELQEELQRIEQRVLRPRGPGFKENDPEQHDGEDQKDVDMKDEKKKRDKFAVDADDKEDSDGDDRHEEEAKVEQPETETQEKMGKRFNHRECRPNTRPSY